MTSLISPNNRSLISNSLYQGLHLMSGLFNKPYSLLILRQVLLNAHYMRSTQSILCTSLSLFLVDSNSFTHDSFIQIQTFNDIFGMMCLHYSARTLFIQCTVSMMQQGARVFQYNYLYYMLKTNLMHSNDVTFMGFETFKHI